MAFVTQSAMSQMDREALLEQMRQQIRLAQILAPEGTEEREIARQQAYADELRKGRMPQGRSAGNIFRAAHPLEFATAAFQQGEGNLAQEGLETRRKQSQQRLFDRLDELAKNAEAQLAGMRQQQTQAAMPTAGRSPWDEPYNPFMGGA